MHIFITLFEGTVGNCILVDTTVSNANVVLQDFSCNFSYFDKLTRDNRQVKVLRL